MNKNRLKDSDTSELFSRALAVKLNGRAYWGYVSELRRRGERATFLTAKELCRSREPEHKVLGIDVLCQLRHYNEAGAGQGNSKLVFVRASTEIACALLKDKRPPVIKSALYALGHLSAARAGKYAAGFSRHRDPEVRLAAAFALAGDESRSAIKALMKLLGDSNAGVRDYAAFALGDMSESDSPEIREALLRGLRERNANVHGEALVGLAKRKDPRVAAHILSDLRRRDPRVYALKAAGYYGGPALLKELKRLLAGVNKKKVNACWLYELKAAIKACRA